MMSIQPTEKPILFSAPMVRAVLSGQKSVTRRLMNPQPRFLNGHMQWRGRDGGCDGIQALCPYGIGGDIMWVRETWGQMNGETDGPDFHFGRADPLLPVVYSASFDHDAWDAPTKWRPSIHMPRWATRLRLKIEQTDYQQVQDIPDVEAWAEGVDSRDEFRALWDELNSARPGGAWDRNPFVWVVRFSIASARIWPSHHRPQQC